MTITSSTITPTERILRLPEVMKRTGLSRSGIYMKVQDNAFPKQISLGNRCSGWIESEVSAWIAARIAASRNRTANPP